MLLRLQVEYDGVYYTRKAANCGIDRGTDATKPQGRIEVNLPRMAQISRNRKIKRQGEVHLPDYKEAPQIYRCTLYNTSAA